MEIVGGLIAGAFIGAVLGFIGAGGAMLSVPILLYIFNFAPKQATTAALAVVFLAALSGAIPKMRSKEILYRDALVIWAIGLITNLGFALVVPKIADDVITSGFALVLVVAGSSMLLGPVKKSSQKMPVPILILVSLIIGAMTGLFGIGGGFLAIPVLVLFFGTQQSVAAGTSLLIIAINSITSFIGHHGLWSQVNWKVPIAMSITAVVVAQGASRAQVKVAATTLRKCFAGLLFAIAIFTLIQTWVIK